MSAARKSAIEQTSFGKEFLGEPTPPDSVREGDKPASRRIDPQTLKSSAGVTHRPAPSAAKLILDQEGKVAEGHLLWMLAMDERRLVVPEQHGYAGRERFEALCREVGVSAEASDLRKALVIEAVVCGRQAGVSEQEIARALGISRSHVSRLVHRAELMERHRSFLEAGLSISHLEAVGPLDEARQVRLLTSALEEDWTVRRLEKRIREDDLTTRRTIGFDRLLLDLLEDAKLGELVPDWKAHSDEWLGFLRKVGRAFDERPHVWTLVVPHGSRRTA